MARRWFVRISVVAVLVGAVVGAVCWRRRHSDDGAITPDATTAAAPDDGAAQAAAVAASTWVAPVDGVCPDGYPVKANTSSGIFHLPGGRFYDRTVPTRCYAAAEAAEADGYRRAKA